MNIVEKRANYLMACFYHQEHTSSSLLFCTKMYGKSIFRKSNCHHGFYLAAEQAASFATTVGDGSS